MRLSKLLASIHVDLGNSYLLLHAHQVFERCTPNPQLINLPIHQLTQTNLMLKFHPRLPKDIPTKQLLSRSPNLQEPPIHIINRLSKDFSPFTPSRDAIVVDSADDLKLSLLPNIKDT
jgi:hypothetical protein